MNAGFLRALFLALVTASALACDGPAVFSRRPPAAEFLLAAGDSTYWIRSSAEGLRVRSAPILLTRTEGRFFEIFLTDEVHDFADASFANARAYRRDIFESDSLLVFENATVSNEFREWVRRHPRAVPLDPDEEFTDDPPPTLVSDDINVLEVHGQWLTFEHLLDVDVAGRASHTHSRRTGVVDVRSGTRATLGTLFGEAESARLIALATRSFADMRDSVRQSSDERSVAARRTLASFVFDSLSFGLTDVGRVPAVTFLVPGTGEEGEALALFLPPLKAAVPQWWKGVELTLPEWNADSADLSWKRTGYDVVARPTSDDELLAIELVDRSHSGAPRVWPIAMVPTPAYQLIALDEQPLDSATRIALARAFDQSTVLNGTARQASLPSQRSATKLRVVDRRVLPGIKNGGTSCCATARRVCGNARSKLPTIHRLPVCADAGHSDSGYRRRLAGL